VETSVADTITIGYFLEDIAQDRFFKALVIRIAEDLGLSDAEIRHETRNATGGAGRVMAELASFFRDYSTGNASPFDLTVVAVDGNCHGYLERIKQVTKRADRWVYPGQLACAVPDPHIERWYLLDRTTLQTVLGAAEVAECPAHKCERDRYKDALVKSIRSAGLTPQFGGAEYGPDIARRLDLYRVGKEDGGFALFVDALKSGLLEAIRSRESAASRTDNGQRTRPRQMDNET
jgi:hypothetical protein